MVFILHKLTGSLYSIIQPKMIRPNKISLFRLLFKKMEEKYKRSYLLWRLYKGIFIALESDLFDIEAETDSNLTFEENQ